MLKAWTVSRATGTGVVAGFAAIVIASLFGGWRGLILPYAGLLALTALCGASILWITAEDVRRRGRGGVIGRIRTFDIALALALLLPSLWALSEVWPQL